MSEKVDLTKIKKNNKILLIFSVIILVLGVIATFSVDKVTLAAVGGFWGGLATFIAILWIVQNTRLQQKSLEMQQDELKMQREATEKAAEAAELDAFLRLFDHAKGAMNKDARNIVLSFLDGGGAVKEKIRLNLEQRYVSGDDQCYMQYISADIDFGEWLEKRDLSIVEISYVNNYLNKFQILDSAIAQLKRDKETYDLIIGSSPISHAERILRKAPKFQASFE